MTKKLISLCTVFLIMVLVLSACNLGSSPSGASTEAANPLNTEATKASTEAPSAPGSCLVGTWSLKDFGPYMDSIKQNLSAKSKNDVTFTSGAFSGSATFVFDAGNKSSLKMDKFTQSFTMSMKVSDNKMEIPITMTVNGSSSADYAVDGDKITFSNQNPGDMKVIITTAGTDSTMDQSMFGDPGTQKLYQYTCPDANTLTLKVIAVENMDLAPLVLTRVP